MSTVMISSGVVVCHVSAGTVLTLDILRAAREAMDRQNAYGGQDIVFIIDEAEAFDMGIDLDAPGFKVQRSEAAFLPRDVPAPKRGPERRNDWDLGRRPSWKVKRRRR